PSLVRIWPERIEIADGFPQPLEVRTRLPLLTRPATGTRVAAEEQVASTVIIWPGAIVPDSRPLSPCQSTLSGFVPLMLRRALRRLTGFVRVIVPSSWLSVLLAERERVPSPLIVPPLRLVSVSASSRTSG